jgi:Uma2 family endonuclease
MHLMIAEVPGFADPDILVDRGYEFVDGRLVEKPSGAQSSHVTVRLLTRLEGATKSGGLGFVFTSGCGYQIFKKDPTRVRRPDLSVVARGRLAGDRLPEGNMRIPPDLAVEVISNDSAEELEARVADYLGAGTRLMWVVYPKARSVWVICAVEVVSPNDLAEEIAARVVDYLEAGTRLMWVVYPQARSVSVVRPDGRAAWLRGEQELSGEDVIPGFACKVQNLFAELGPP